jgi:hypothetical protein
MHKTTIAVTTAALVFVPIAANAAGSSHQLAAKKTPKPPVKGTWKVVNDTNGPEVTGGSMKVTKGHKDIKAIVIKLGSQTETTCGVAGNTYKIPAKQKIIDAKGLDEFDDGSYNFWAVGKNDQTADPVIQPHAVKLYINGKKRNAKFWMRFEGQKKGNGEITFGTANSCQLDFGFKR